MKISNLKAAQKLLKSLNKLLQLVIVEQKYDRPPSIVVTYANSAPEFLPIHGENLAFSMKGMFTSCAELKGSEISLDSLEVAARKVIESFPEAVAHIPFITECHDMYVEKLSEVSPNTPEAVFLKRCLNRCLDTLEIFRGIEAYCLETAE